MSKVICDVCGTSFPETSAQCPICGSACNSAAAASGVESAVEAGAGGNYVRGGRFSKGNVKKANEGRPVPERRGDAPRRERPRPSTISVPPCGGAMKQKGSSGCLSI